MSILHSRRENPRKLGAVHLRPELIWTAVVKTQGESHGKQSLRHHHRGRRFGRRSIGQIHGRARGSSARRGARQALQGPHPWRVNGTVGCGGNEGAWHL